LRSGDHSSESESQFEVHSDPIQESTPDPNRWKINKPVVKPITDGESG